jgi:phosphatidylinositol-3,4,5-trisphosphate 3-phosphatase and dual-specificity protein phosphatase PTEN
MYISGSEALYRNPATEVKKFFNQRHPHHNRIYNLCAEKEYSILDIFEQVDTNFRFMDHYPCPLDMLAPFCRSVEKYLDEDERNVVAIHCKAGKGRTGLMICVLLVHLYKMTPQEALDLFAVKRTQNRKGVTIPSQWRYIHYYHHMQSTKINTRKEFRVTHVRLNTVPSCDLTGGCNPYFRVYVMWTDVSGKLKEDEVFNYSKNAKIRRYNASDKYVDLDCSNFDLVVSGDVKFVFYDANQITKHEKIFHFVFHTGFVKKNFLCLKKNYVDKACKDKDHSTFDKNFHVEIFFDEVKDESNTIRPRPASRSRVESSLFGDTAAHHVDIQKAMNDDMKRKTLSRHSTAKRMQKSSLSTDSDTDGSPDLDL